MQNQRLNIQRIKLEVRVGNIIQQAIKPHSVNQPKGSFLATPEFFINDPHGNRNYVGYLRALNPADLPGNYGENFQGYKVIVRDILPLEDDNGNTIIYLEERVEEGNGVYVLVDGHGPSKRRFMHGRFLNYEGDSTRYAVYIRQEETDVKVNQGEYIFGKVLSVNENNLIKPKFDLKPLKIVEKNIFNSEKNRIIRLKKS